MFLQLAAIKPILVFNMPSLGAKRMEKKSSAYHEQSVYHPRYYVVASKLRSKDIC